MALPPERISVKRRRDDAPIETFYLEEHHPSKRRITAGTSVQAYQFRLIKASAIVPISQQQPLPCRSEPTSSALKSAAESTGIPYIRTTAPGDEVADFAKFKQKQAASVARTSLLYDGPDIEQVSAQQQPAPTNVPTLSTANARRFHLTRDLASTLSSEDPVSSSSSKARRPTPSIRPPLPTFIEKSQPYDSIYMKPPVDRLVSEHPIDHEHKTTSASQMRHQVENPPPTLSTQSTAPVVKDGVSLNDPASSWNTDSDQLADELAALAMDLDPDVRLASPIIEEPKSWPRPEQTLGKDVEFIYETYMRMPYDAAATSGHLGQGEANFGVLVIDEADEEFWHEYMQSDEDSDWDEEDSNAEDNPANDYPDEDLSPDDEYDRNAYRYHRGDEDEYGFDEDDDRD